MTRKEMYNLIKKNDLNEMILFTFGRSFTNLSNKVLEEFLNSLERATTQKCCHTKTSSTQKSEDINNLKRAFVELVTQLNHNRIVSDTNAARILNIL